MHLFNVDFRDKIISEVRGSPEQLVYRKLLTASSESLESSSSPEDSAVNYQSSVVNFLIALNLPLKHFDLKH
jgi:lysyl-tRNA synthetase class I